MFKPNIYWLFYLFDYSPNINTPIGYNCTLVSHLFIGSFYDHGIGGILLTILAILRDYSFSMMISFRVTMGHFS